MRNVISWSFWRPILVILVGGIVVDFSLFTAWCSNSSRWYHQCQARAQVRRASAEAADKAAMELSSSFAQKVPKLPHIKKTGEVFILGIFFFFLGDFFSFFGPLVPWSSNPLVPWSSRPPSSRRLIVWSPVPWSSGPLVLWSPGPLVLWSPAPLVFWFPGPLFFFVPFFLTCLLLCFTIRFIYSLCLVFVSLVFLCYFHVAEVFMRFSVLISFIFIRCMFFCVFFRLCFTCFHVFHFLCIFVFCFVYCHYCLLF